MMRTAFRIFADSNGATVVAVTFAVALILGACGPAGTTQPDRSASARPTKSPIPTLAAGMTRFTGHVTDSDSGQPIPDVCVIIGPPADCTENLPHSDADGVWMADLPVAGGSLAWTFTFVKDGYQLTTKKATSTAPGEQIIDAQLAKK